MQLIINYPYFGNSSNVNKTKDVLFMKHQFHIRTVIAVILVIILPLFSYAQPANDNCSGAVTLVSGNTCSSTSSTVQFATSSSIAGGCGGATTSTTYDVWFKFQAVNANTAINLNIQGSRFSTNTPYIEVLSGTCAGTASVSCQAAATSGLTRVTLNSLTVGNFYFIRVYTLVSPAASGNGKWNFSICVQHQPLNDDCTGAITLTPNATCVNTAGTLDMATVNATIPVGCLGAGTYYDVWYKFTAAATTNYTVTLSSLGLNITNPRIQIFSGICGGTLTSLSCSSIGFLTQAVVSGTTYYIRIANATTNPSGTGTVANFNICLSTSAAPANDVCSGAYLLTSGTNCASVTVGGTLINATASGSSACGSIIASSADVWYTFVAQSSFPTITVSESFPSGGNAGIEIYSVCGGSPLGTCATNSFSVASQYPTGLTPGTTYWVRVGCSKSIGSPTSGAYDFTICITDPVSVTTTDYGKSYVNITKGTSGGTITPGDVLEIRATLVIGGSGYVDSVAYYDTLKAGGGFALVPGTISLRTNEGKLYKLYTDVMNDDAGWYNTAGAGTDTVIQINMGTGATKSARGRIYNTSKPSNFGSTCIVMATFRVTINGAYDTKVNFGGGKFTFKDPTTGIFSSINFPADSLMIYSSPGLCPNAVSPTNIVSDETGGTFGASAGNRNRSTSANTNYIYATFGSGGPNDYYYGIANNTSGNTYVTTNTFPKVSGTAQRVFGVWDITGDHTGASNITSTVSKGNPPCNTSLPISASNPCGYMLVVNSAYNTDTAFQYTVSNVCANTNYEISAWFKNMCYKCGCDSNGVSALSGSSSYIPFDVPTKDSSGIQPNIAVAIDGVDYYTTGNIPYTGIYPATQTGSDSVNRWVKKGFTFKTGVNQTSFVLTFRNNAPGGGGNDWAIDDIAMSTCLPNMSYSPTMNPTVCDSNLIIISDTIRSYFNNYVYYKWQRSTDGGSTWSDIAGTSGIGTPVWNGTSWEYIASYTIPPTDTYAANNGDKYRVIVATTSNNLSSADCQNTDGVSIVTISVIPCQPVLTISLLSFNGKLVADKGKLSWTMAKQDEALSFTVERSNDGINFFAVGVIAGNNNYSSEVNYYSFTDPTPVVGKVWYRLVITNSANKKKVSSTIQLATQFSDFALGNVVNPFHNELVFDITTTQSVNISAELIDMFGKTVKKSNYMVYSGVNSISIPNTDKLPAGMYTLRILNKEIVQSKQVIKIQ